MVLAAVKLKVLLLTGIVLTKDPPQFPEYRFQLVASLAVPLTVITTASPGQKVLLPMVELVVRLVIAGAVQAEPQEKAEGQKLATPVIKASLKLQFEPLLKLLRRVATSPLVKAQLLNLPLSISETVAKANTE